MTSPVQPVTTTVKKKRDEVKRDGVLKEQVRNEKEAKLIWDRKWNCMDEFEKILVEEATKEGMTEDEFKNFRISKPGKKPLKVNGWNPIPSEKYPVTSTGMVGWRSSRQECAVERFGPLYTSPRFTINYPSRSPSPPQNYIILG